MRHPYPVIAAIFIVAVVTLLFVLTKATHAVRVADLVAMEFKAVSDANDFFSLAQIGDRRKAATARGLSPPRFRFA